jgi:hypothetical protein
MSSSHHWCTTLATPCKKSYVTATDTHTAHTAHQQDDTLLEVLASLLSLGSLGPALPVMPDVLFFFLVVPSSYLDSQTSTQGGCGNVKRRNRVREGGGVGMPVRIFLETSAYRAPIGRLLGV